MGWAYEGLMETLNYAPRQLNQIAIIVIVVAVVAFLLGRYSREMELRSSPDYYYLGSGQCVRTADPVVETHICKRL